MWFYRITLRGYAEKDKTSLTFQLDTSDAPLLGHVEAKLAANSIRGSLVDITDAFVVSESVTEVYFEDNQRPPEGVKAFEEAALIVYLNDPATAEKLHTLRVPAPIPAMFEVDGQTVDTSNALVKQFIQQVSQGAWVSDGEQIVVDAANNDGFKKGYKRSKAKRFN